MIWEGRLAFFHCVGVGKVFTLFWKENYNREPGRLTEEIFEKVANYLVEESETDLELKEITRDTNLREDLDLDSLQSLSMVLDLEEEYGISIEEEEIPKLKTVGEVVDLIEQKRKSEEG